MTPAPFGTVHALNPIAPPPCSETALPPDAAVRLSPNMSSGGQQEPLGRSVGPGVLGQLVRAGKRGEVSVKEISQTEVRLWLDRQLFPRLEIAVHFRSRRILATVTACRRVSDSRFEVLAEIEAVSTMAGEP